MFCTDCGKENRENSKYCSACGAGLSVDIAESIARESEREGEPGQTKKNAMDWYFDVLKKYATFSGRARRKEFWMFLLFHLIIFIILGFVELLGVRVHELVLLYIFANFLPYLAVSVRRLHDTNRSGWWLLISFVPIIGPGITLAFMVFAGDPSENKYGPNPKAAVGAM